MEAYSDFGAERSRDYVEDPGSTKERLNSLRVQVDLGAPVRAHLRATSEREFRSSDPRERARAARYLPKSWNLDLFEALFRDPDARVRRALLKNMFLSRHFPELNEALYKDDNPDVRAAAAENFMLLLHRPDLVHHYLGDESALVRAGIAKIWNRSFGHTNRAAKLLVDDSPLVRDALRQNPWIRHQLNAARWMRTALSGIIRSNR